jgi:hypothetical protein
MAGRLRSCTGQTHSNLLLLVCCCTIALLSGPPTPLPATSDQAAQLGRWLVSNRQSSVEMIVKEEKSFRRASIASSVITSPSPFDIVYEANTLSARYNTLHIGSLHCLHLLCCNPKTSSSQGKIQGNEAHFCALLDHHRSAVRYEALEQLAFQSLIQT